MLDRQLRSWLDAPMQKLTLRRFVRLACIAVCLFASSLGAWYLWTKDWHQRFIQVDDIERRYLWYEPTTASEKLRPLVLVYHGFSGDAERIRASSLLHQMVEEEGVFLAYIDGDTTWHCFTIGSPESNPDIRLFDVLLDDLLERYPIDPKRVYAVGMSRGGDFVVHLAMRRSQHIAAVVAQGACMLDELEAEQPMPMMFVVGTADGEVTTKTIETVPDLYRDRGHEVTVVRPSNGPHRWDRSYNDDIWKFLSTSSLDDVRVEPLE
jgi:poly(3-hydroxybutyrate) depolymerase